MARNYTWHRSRFSATASDGFTRFAFRGADVPEASTLERIICDFQIRQRIDETSSDEKSSTSPDGLPITCGLVGIATDFGRPDFDPSGDPTADWLWVRMLQMDLKPAGSFQQFWNPDPNFGMVPIGEKTFLCEINGHIDVTTRRVMNVDGGVTFWILSEPYSVNEWTAGVQEAAVLTNSYMSVLVSTPA